MVEQSGPRLTVRLSGADFIVTNGRGDHFSGAILGDDRVTFAVGDAYYYYYYFGQFGVVERFSPSEAFVIGGIITAQSRATTITGVLNGTLALARKQTAPFVPFATSCYSNEHRFEMLRR